MKKWIFASLMMLCLGMTGRAANDSEIKNLKARQEVLKLTTKLNALKICYEKELAKLDKYQAEATEVNANADATQVITYSTENAAAVAKAAKERAKQLKKVTKANKRLDNQRKKLKKLEEKMSKTQNQLDQFNKRIEFVSQ